MEIIFEKVSYEYPNGSSALKNISFNICRPEVIGIIGENGSGKSTLSKHFNGLLRPTSGRVLLNGKNMSNYSISEISEYIGYVFQNPNDQLFLESVKKEFLFNHRLEKNVNDTMLNIADLVGLNDRLYDHPLDLLDSDKVFCAIGSVLMRKPKLILFDEPTSGQDSYGLTKLINIINLLKDEGVITLIISHNINFICEISDRVLVMNDGVLKYDGDLVTFFGNKEWVYDCGLRESIPNELGRKVLSNNNILTKKEFVNTYLDNMFRR